jgi:hypothetical protein
MSAPRISSYWLRFVRRADYRIARELVAGLTSDLFPSHRSLWPLMGVEPCSFDRAMFNAMRTLAT